MTTFAQTLNSALVAKIIPAEGDAFVTMHPRAVEQTTALTEKLNRLYPVDVETLDDNQKEAIMAGVDAMNGYYGEVVDGVVQPMNEELFTATLQSVETKDVMWPFTTVLANAVFSIIVGTDKLKV